MSVSFFKRSNWYNVEYSRRALTHTLSTGVGRLVTDLLLYCPLRERQLCYLLLIQSFCSTNYSSLEFAVKPDDNYAINFSNLSEQVGTSDS